MKKWLVVFFIFDLVFVGLVWHLTQKGRRQIATDSDPYYQTLSDGQKTKWDLVKTFIVVTDTEKIIFKSDLIPTLCENHSRISLKFVALNVAYAGESPFVLSEFSCQNIRGNQLAIELATPLNIFSQLATSEEHVVLVDDKRFSSHLLRSDEELPTEWRLAEVIVSGESSFSISSLELDKVHTDRRFYFDLQQR